jgi:16S rRNA (adenine1518-N6/adenine1519-N6)-dimethyltransferase
MFQPRKRFGQHFLHDPGVIQRIVQSIDPARDDRLVEIGPGLGSITKPLLRCVDQLHAIEIDRDAIRYLQTTFGADGSLHIHEADVLDFDFGALRLDGPRLRLVGNLPYNISTPLLFRLIEQRAHLLDMHFMLQKEVVARMAAQPGGKDYGRLTLMLAPWLTIEPLFDIGPGAFNPPPRVTSTFVRLQPRSTSPVAPEHSRAYATIVAAAFSKRRKTLRNALRPLLGPEDISAAGIDPGARPEVITASGFAALAVRFLAKSS